MPLTELLRLPGWLRCWLGERLGIHTTWLHGYCGCDLLDDYDDYLDESEVAA